MLIAVTLGVVVLGVSAASEVVTGSVTGFFTPGCSQSAADAKSTAERFPVLDDRPESMAAAPGQPAWSDACGPGDNPNVGGATLDLIGSADQASLQAYYAKLLDQDGWQKIGTSHASGGGPCYAKTIGSVRYEVGLYSAQPKQFTVDLVYSFGSDLDDAGALCLS